MLNFHWVLFSLFQGLSMKTYRRVYFSLCLFLAISGRPRTQRKLNPRKKFPIYGMLWTQFSPYAGICDDVEDQCNIFMDFFHQGTHMMSAVALKVKCGPVKDDEKSVTIKTISYGHCGPHKKQCINSPSDTLTISDFNLTYKKFVLSICMYGSRSRNL